MNLQLSTFSRLLRYEEVGWEQNGGRATMLARTRYSPGESSQPSTNLILKIKKGKTKQKQKGRFHIVLYVSSNFHVLIGICEGSSGELRIHRREHATKNITHKKKKETNTAKKEFNKREVSRRGELCRTIHFYQRT